MTREIWSLIAAFSLFMPFAKADAIQNISLYRQADGDWRKAEANDIKENVMVDNGKLNMVFRKGGHDVPVGVQSEGSQRPAGAIGLGGTPAISQLKVAAGNGQVDVAVDFTSAAGTTQSVVFTVKGNDETVELKTARDMQAVVSLNVKSRYVIAPDFFTDDFVWDASDGNVKKLNLPEGFMTLHLSGDGDIMAVCAAGDRKSRRTIEAVDAPEGRRFNGAEIEIGKGGKACFGFLSAKGIWRAVDADSLSETEDVKLGAIAFPAVLVADFIKTGQDGKLCDTFYGAVKKKGSDVYKLSSDGKWLTRGASANKRMTFINGYGAANLPFIIDAGQGFIRTPNFTNITFDYSGQTLIYPLEKAKIAGFDFATPADIATPMDIMKKTLGDGYLATMGVEHLRKNPYIYKTYTCKATADFEAIFRKGQEREKKAEIAQSMKYMDDFVKMIKDRMGRYLEFHTGVMELCDAEKLAHPGDKALADSIAASADEIPKAFDNYKNRLLTLEEANKLSQDVVTLIDSEGDREAKAIDLGKRIRMNGGAQDSVSSLCNFSVRKLRQKAGRLYAASVKEDEKAFLMKIMARTEDMLRLHMSVEGR